MIETWACQEDLARHSESGHVKAFQATQKDNLEAKIQLFQPV
jgi:quinol monooxygenase YgiN